MSENKQRETTGIKTTKKDNKSTIRNNKITDCCTGIEVGGSGESLIEGNRITNSKPNIIAIKGFFKLLKENPRMFIFGVIFGCFLSLSTIFLVVRKNYIIFKINDCTI